MKYFKRVLLSVDQFFNAVTGGDEDETISSRAAKARDKGKKWGKVLCWGLDKIDPCHCEKSIEEDEGLVKIEVKTETKQTQTYEETNK
jgi:hypothetical protein